MSLTPNPAPSLPRAPRSPQQQRLPLPPPRSSGGKGFLWHPFPRTHLAHWQPICPETAADATTHSRP